MKRYYLIRSSSDPKIIGVKNGIQQVEIYRQGFKDQSMYDLIMKYWGSFDSWDHKNDYHGSNVELQCVKPLKNAKMTSFLSYGPHLINCPFLISDDVKNVIEKFCMPEHYFYKANVSVKENYINYHLFSCPDLGYSVIDFKKTVFFTGNELLGKTYLSINEYSDFMKFYSETNKVPQMEKIYFNENFNPNFDFFILGNSINFISERLMLKIKECNFDGINILPAFGEGIKWPEICS